MGRGGQPKGRDDGPERRCIVTGATGPRDGLVRFIVGPDGTVVADVLGKLPGRGIWVTASRQALEKAVAKGMFARAARQPVKTPPDLADQVESMLARRVVDLISLARKSGGAVTGYEKVKDWLATGRAKVLLQASDGSERGKSKLSTPQGGNWIGWLTAEELGLAFGRQTVVHAALSAGGLATRVVEEAARLKGLRLADAQDAPRRKGLKG